ncbi:conserved oligomeric Golgi complex subunit 6 [Tribolium castaneum]|uniref:Conserved oligomeric Golgi complex subunit 6 n=1 Tax=Tribolium castaneum TaxID=7070 RepID=D6WE56_TRICA|nr:PREDICTED: conserved oligomeric Golgi complex subunit 6 [Tribolium castaneum]EFA00369.1 Conserved oligomeric Golgi complex subunit 6-like Protein [Tribolium castaneum]|eukprot:XP_970899.1 PREDICTED: conserved oligomeric Golgi complex subunit 6 [Tribolium castaneum]
MKVSENEKENVLSRRLNKILETRLENDQDTLEALKQLSTFYTENTLQARRNLRSQIEKRSLDINENFLASFREVKLCFDAVYNDVSEMSKSIQEMTHRLHNAKMQTKQLLEQTKSLQESGEKNDMQQQIVHAFLETFQLTPDELVALHGNKQKRDAPLTNDIFSALDHIQKIHSDCKVLMQSGHQTLALDIMEQMTLHQEGALERLYRWTQHHCRNVDNPDLTEIITQAMARLQERQMLFKYIIDEYCIARRSVLVGEFINALTRGGPSGNPAPIELRAHDPQIYITDMLVWLNKAIPLEKQNLHLLVKLCDKTDLNQQLNEALASICEGVCQPLKIRIEKILTSSVAPSILYAVTNLIRYYKKCICKIVTGGLLETTLVEVQERSEGAFLTTLQQQVNNILVRVEAPPRDLSPTPSINHLLAILRDTLSTASVSEGRESDMGKIAQCIMEPLLRAVNEQASRLPPTDMAVYMLNCMYSMYTCLSLYEFMDERLERLQAQSDAQIDTLTSEQASSLVANLNLGPIYTILQDHTQGPLSGIPGMEPTNLKNFLAKLDYLLASPDSVLLPQINLLLSSKHKKAVQKRAFDVLLAIYKQLYEGVHNPDNLYENPGSILSKTPDELMKMLN